jgi:hypothetical protein
MTRIVLSTLSSHTHWLNTRIDNMSASYIQNCLRLLFRDPIATLHGCARGEIREMISTSWLDWPDDVDPDLLGSEFAELMSDVRRRCKLDAATAVLEGDEFEIVRDALDEVRGIDTMDVLIERAQAWISERPTVVALSAELLKRIIDGRINVHDTIVDLDPSAPTLPTSED